MFLRRLQKWWTWVKENNIIIKRLIHCNSGTYRKFDLNTEPTFAQREIYFGFHCLWLGMEFFEYFVLSKITR